MSGTQTPPAQSELSVEVVPPTPYLTGAQKQNTHLDYLIAHQFIVQQLLATMHGSMLVRVDAVSNEGGITATGTVSITPLVSLIDGDGNGHERGTIGNVPYSRVQGGKNALIIDPEVGDIGIAVSATGISVA